MECSLLISGSSDRTLRLWRLPKKLYTYEKVKIRPLIEVFKFLSPKEVVKLGRVNTKFYEASFHTELWGQLPSFQQVQVIEEHSLGISSLAISKKKLLVASGSYDKTIQIWSLTTGKQVQTFKGHTGWIWSVRFLEDSQFLLSGASDHTVRVWDLINIEQTQLINVHANGVWSIGC